ncbi:MAG: response regulator [Bacteroidales bacterium]|nr:response regulator [Bacteroidales bacterium]
MKRLTILTVILFLVVVLINYIYYNGLYNKQISYVKDLLGQQVAIIGSEVNNTNITFESDLNEIIMHEELSEFFNEDVPDVKERIIEKFKFYYSKYDNFVETIEYNGPQTQVFMLYKDLENDEWIANTYLAQDQKELLARDKLEPNRNKWDLIMPVYSTNDDLIGNIIITVDYLKYFSSLFRKYKLEDQQWQWLLNEVGEIVFSNYFDDNLSNRANINDVEVRNLRRINEDIAEGVNSNMEHSIVAEGSSRRVISSYYAVELLRRDFGMVFSAPADFYQIYIIRNSLLIVSLTILLITLLILLYRRYIRKQAYSASRLRESEQTFIRLIELMPVGVVVVNKENEILKANESAATMFDYQDEKEMEGKIMPESEHSGQGLFFAENLGPGFEPDQFMMIKKQGVDTVLYRKKIPVAYQGKEASMIVLMDVTLLETARKQEAKAKEAKSEFLTKISHEIRTPLNGIIGMIDMLAKKENDPETRKIINLVKNSSDLLMEIVNDLLDFSKIEEGGLVLDEVPFDIRKEIEYCFNVEDTLVKDKLKINWEADRSVPESVIGDPFRLRKVITNLLAISLEHTEKGEVRLNVSSAKVGKGIVSLKFNLMDTGKGYDNTVLKKLFGDYIKSESRIVTQYGSKGLGGAIAKQLIEMMGGNLNVSTPSGISNDPESPGACFEFNIQVYSNIRMDKKYGAEGVEKYSEIKTLVVNGSRQRDEELLNTLHKLGLATYVTSWQKQTVNLIKSNLEQVKDRYKVIVIMDTSDFDGFEVAETLWENDMSMRFMILMVSSNDKRGNYARCIKYGIDDYLVKPYNSNELLNIIRNRFPNVETPGKRGSAPEIKKDLNILVVEDNIISQKVAATIIKSIGYEADLANDGKEGLEKAANKKYDIVFMDLIMPEMDGYTASKKILEKSPGTIIIALSADSTSESATKAEIAGIKQFISKPVKQEDIKEIFIKYFSN